MVEPGFVHAQRQRIHARDRKLRRALHRLQQMGAAEEGAKASPNISDDEAAAAAAAEDKKISGEIGASAMLARKIAALVARAEQLEGAAAALDDADNAGAGAQREKLAGSLLQIVEEVETAQGAATLAWQATSSDEEEVMM
jgi:hypothetical protein